MKKGTIKTGISGKMETKGNFYVNPLLDLYKQDKEGFINIADIKDAFPLLAKKGFDYKFIMSRGFSPKKLDFQILANDYYIETTLKDFDVIQDRIFQSLKAMKDNNLFTYGWTF